MYSLITTLLLILIDISEQKSTCMIFFTGGSNLISPQLYLNFLNKFNKYDIPVFKLPYNVKNKEIIKELNSEYNVILAGHSSGCVTAINNCNENIKKLILLDPVKTPFLKNTNLESLDKVLVINAGKSYKWSIIPPFLPFIPFFQLTKDNICNMIGNSNKLCIIKVHDYGHCDIIENPYRNVMHYTRLSVGNNKRSYKYINAYHDFLAKHICKFIKEPETEISDIC